MDESRPSTRNSNPLIVIQFLLLISRIGMLRTTVVLQSCEGVGRGGVFSTVLGGGLKNLASTYKVIATARIREPSRAAHPPSEIAKEDPAKHDADHNWQQQN